jgi:hypothetical protein
MPHLQIPSEEEGRSKGSRNILKRGMYRIVPIIEMRLKADLYIGVVCCSLEYVVVFELVVMEISLYNSYRPIKQQ